MTSTTAGKHWAQEIIREKSVNRYPKFPNEVMLKSLFGSSSYHNIPVDTASIKKVLDIGCGFGNNLIPFYETAECFGCDIDAELISVVQDTLSSRNLYPKLSVGSNTSIPFPDSSFDLLLSINTLHYESTPESFASALKEFCRVLSTGKYLYLSTVAPRHTIRKRSTPVRPNVYKLNGYDFRDGQEFTFFDDASELKDLLENYFRDVEVYRVSEIYPKITLDFFVSVCIK